VRWLRAVHYIGTAHLAGITLAATIAAKIISRMSRHAVAWVRRTSITLIIGVIHTWWRIEPHLRQFDRLLERKLKKNKDIAALLHLGSELVKLVQAWITELRGRINRAVEK